MCSQYKKHAAIAALNYVSFDLVVGIGSGSTISYFIQVLSTVKNRLIGVISSSNNTTFFLRQYGIRVCDINTIFSPIIYIDSVDEINNNLESVKGGGAALTKEKIIASISKKFICIIDQSKQVHTLGFFPVPLEIIPISYSYIKQEIIKLGGVVKYRYGIVTDNGNIVVDIYNLNLECPILIENKINSLPGVVTVGLFTYRKPDVIVIGTKYGVKIL
ncbi:ribose-5-phosphate isomerase RpiA [Buchnera aphidicola (Stegophylla sp.)]|uniref:Ribose-5-phosphate isomerase A n=2 Tax=Buchnera aphidicola TaxID=9 RepID=A0A4D6YJ13_9GAMM|nr:ribose-5-phosphate isomerase RpiA [Buchnera aphidicola (Stegophylla sp.)]QCI26421.1 ribose-5-phosphate isomerase RpiA [Buchnera aphidicola (Stegophylla sp.)]